MSEPLDKEGCFFMVLTMAVLILLIDMCIDLYAGRRDMNHIKDLQRRVAVLEQR